MAGKGKQTRKAGRGKSRPASDLRKSIRDHSNAVDKIGRKNIKRGSHLLGATGFITPTKRGFNALRHVVNEIKNVKSVSTFTYKLRIKRPSGKIIEVTPAPSNIIPRHNREKKLEKRVRTAKGQSARTEAAHELFMERIRSEVFANRIKITRAQSEAYRQLRTKDKKAAREFLDKLQQRKGITFQFEVYREL